MTRVRQLVWVDPMEQFCRRLLLFVFVASLMVSQSVDGQMVSTKSPRRIAPGVLNVIKPDLDARDSFSIPFPLPGLNAADYQPNYIAKKQTLLGQTRRVVLFRDVWNYEFAFLGLRQIELADGKVAWYMVYRIRNTGKTLSYKQVKENPKFDHMKNELVRDDANVETKEFLPRFSIEGWASDGRGNYREVVYRDQVSPELVRMIQQREDPNRHLLNTIEMSQTKIPVSKDPTNPGVWGVAVWENVDPTIDYVSVFVSGLTNAYRISLSPEGKPGFTYRTLQLNFWRPGDKLQEIKDRIDYGIPLVDDSGEQIEICRRYNLPGPVFRAYRIDENANQNILVMEADAEVSLSTFSSPYTPELGAENGDKGIIPEILVKALADSGVNVAQDAETMTIVKGQQWSFQDTDGTPYVMQLEPQFWEPTITRKGIRFIKTLDHLWIYR